MPGVRYGPDIADDAAYVLNNLVDSMRKYRETGKVDKKYTKFAKMASQIFGVSDRDIKKGKYGKLAELAQYSAGGISPYTGKAYKRSKLEKSWRTGKIMQRGVRQEFIKRGEDPSGRALKGVRRGRGKRPPDIIPGVGTERQGRGGATYLGRSRTAKFVRLEQEALRRAKRNKVSIGGARVKKGNRSEIDSLNIARQGRFLPNVDAGFGASSRRTGSTIRPPKSKTAARASQAKRVKTVKGAGKPRGKKKR